MAYSREMYWPSTCALPVVDTALVKNTVTAIVFFRPQMPNRYSANTTLFTGVIIITCQVKERCHKLEHWKQCTYSFLALSLK